MRRLDRLVDTRAKRRCCVCVITLIAMLCLLVTYLMLAMRLIECKEYQDVFSLLQRVEVSMTYLSRIVITLVGKASIDLFDIVKALFSSLRGWEVLTILLWIGMWKLSDPIAKRYIRYIGYLVGMCGLSIIAILITGFSATTLLQVVYALQAIGYSLVCFMLLCSMLCMYMLFFIALPAYQEALNYEVIEIEKSGSMEDEG